MSRLEQARIIIEKFNTYNSNSSLNACDRFFCADYAL